MSKIKVPLKSTVFIECVGTKTNTIFPKPSDKQKFIIYENKDFLKKKTRFSLYRKKKKNISTKQNRF